MKSVMKHQFSQIPRAEIQRSSFDRSHGYKTTFDSGYLVPFYVDEVLPGDTFNVNATTFARLATPIAPIMDNMYLDTFYFFVPSRLVWNHWVNLNGEQTNPGDSTDYLVPTLSGKFDEGSLGDYFGIPISVNTEVNALPFRAYHKIYDDWFRDENLQNSVLSDSTFFGDGPDKMSQMNVLHRRGKRHDYFTACLPWPQKGPGVELPLGSTAPVIGSGYALGLTNGSVNFGFQVSDSGLNIRSGNYGKPVGSAGSSGGTSVGTSAKVVGVTTDGDKSGLVADLSQATAATINSLRQAFQIQRMYEKDARGGTRYTEILRCHFGVVSPDARLQRSEYLGGSSTPIMINQVAQTSSTDQESPQGNMAAFGLVSGMSGFKKSFTEHGYVIGLVNVRADLNYQQGLNKMWSRRTRFDFYWPSFAHLGEQAVLNKEIYLQGNADDDGVFGYQERYAEYRYHPSQITGQLRSTCKTPLDYWHLAQKFTSLPRLNAEFIEDNPPIDRVIAVQDYPQFVFDSYVQCRCVRPMPVYSVPGLIDHF